MKRFTRVMAGAVLLAGLLNVAVKAQDGPTGPRTSQAYYKIEAGHQDEWLNLYKHYHYPILKELKAKGYIQSITLYKRDRHHLVPAWDYELQIVWRDKEAQIHGDGPDGLHKIFPDFADYQKNEARRWEITAEHWDEDLSPVPVE